VPVAVKLMVTLPGALTDGVEKLTQVLQNCGWASKEPDSAIRTDNMMRKERVTRTLVFIENSPCSTYALRKLIGVTALAFPPPGGKAERSK